MGVRPEYLAQFEMVMQDWEDYFWPIMARHGISKDASWLSFMAHRVELSVGGFAGPQQEEQEEWQKR